MDWIAKAYEAIQQHISEDGWLSPSDFRRIIEEHKPTKE